MIVFVVYSETCRQSSKIIDGPEVWSRHCQWSQCGDKRHLSLHHPAS